MRHQETSAPGVGILTPYRSLSKPVRGATDGQIPTCLAKKIRGEGIVRAPLPDQAGIMHRACVAPSWYDERTFCAPGAKDSAPRAQRNTKSRKAQGLRVHGSLAAEPLVNRHTILLTLARSAVLIFALSLLQSGARLCFCGRFSLCCDRTRTQTRGRPSTSVRGH